MKELVTAIIKKHYRSMPESITRLDTFGGCSFRADFLKPPYRADVTLYRAPKLAENDAKLITLFGKASVLKAPMVYFVGGMRGTEYLITEHIDGIRASAVDPFSLPETIREYIGASIIENLISLHEISNSGGFGGVLDGKLFPTWEEYYYEVAAQAVAKAHFLCDKGFIAERDAEVFDLSIKRFSDIFTVPVDHSSLLHGDYSVRNILLSPSKRDAVAVLNPFSCMWGDREYDLCRLDSYGGFGYGLSEIYRSRIPLSPDFDKKSRFYALYSLIGQCFDLRINPDKAEVRLLSDSLREIL